MEREEMEFEFLCRSIADKQSAIRGVDVKCGFLLVVVFAPIAELGKIYNVYQYVTDVHCLFYIPVLAVVFSWLLSVYALFKCVSSINSPAKHIRGEKPEGYFYTSGLFSFGWSSLFSNKRVESNRTLREYVGEMPSNSNGVVEELIFENMKLAYIRDVKGYRSAFCVGAMLIWVLVGIFLWAIFLGAGGANA